MRALVVDGEHCFREQLEQILAERGVETYWAGGVAEARRILRRVQIHLLIVDIGLAESKSERELVAWTRQMHGDAVVIVTAGGNTPEFRHRCRDLGALACLVKPVSPRDCELQIQRAIDRFQLLGEVHRLERELAQAERSVFFGEHASALPVACISQAGEVLYTSVAGQDALDALVEPALLRPARSVDTRMLARLRRAARGREWQRTTLPRRAEVAEKCSVFVRRVKLGLSEALIAFFAGACTASSKTPDEMWLAVLPRADREVRGKRPRAAISAGGGP